MSIRKFARPYKQRKITVSPSVLDLDLANFKNEIRNMDAIGIRSVHIDVMDGKFVKNSSLGNTFLRKIPSDSKLYKDVHIMVSNPYSKVTKYKKAGTNCLTFHYEAYKYKKRVIETINKIKESGMEVGISIKPSTPISEIVPFLPLVDRVLIMSVEPGLGGQKFIESSYKKIAELKKEIRKTGSKARISVDGGINDSTGPKCLKSGASILVSGKYLFKNNPNNKELKDRYERLVK